ncbi:unnamed protein product [Cyprideis torosa]|uniref:Uncharacterized protein n=1 Tax=Cyprideis torosa TaxID=163714 RepID=A0A7R8WL23_9CRUS|nr:unnamed protein product [Cyprideis torosa]CAG0903854.1 unnamed protein product [Cyprideis torosa]
MERYPPQEIDDAARELIQYRKRNGGVMQKGDKNRSVSNAFITKELGAVRAVVPPTLGKVDLLLSRRGPHYPLPDRSSWLSETFGPVLGPLSLAVVGVSIAVAVCTTLFKSTQGPSQG